MTYGADAGHVSAAGDTLRDAINEQGNLRKSSMRNLLSSLAGMLLAVSASAQIPEGLLRPWSEVEAVMEAPGTLRYDSSFQSYWLTRDGRFAVGPVATEEEDTADRPASLGTWSEQGAWLTLRQRYLAYPSDAALAQARKKLEDYRAELEANADTPEKQAELAEQFAAWEEMAERQQEEPVAGMRLLRVPYAGGELLVPEWSVKFVASRWDGKGPLELTPAAWRLPPGQVTEDPDGLPTFEIHNPLSAGLPVELAGLLRRDAIQGSVVEVLDTPETLKWESHAATVRVKLDRGANHGLYQDMDLYGLPPDEDFFAQVKELEGEEAVALVHVSRFSATDVPDLPVRGLRFTTRRQTGTGCHIDTSAAVRGKVLAVATPPKGVAWDKDGFAFVEMTIDQGSRHGLLAGDRFGAEIDEVDGEGRVQRIEPERAVVLWRVQRYDEDEGIHWPAVGDALVTPAWQRAADDTFGSEAGE
jgi:hypothetical protein